MAVHTDTKGDKVFGVVNAAVLCLLSVAFVLPLWHCVVASFSRPDELIRHTGILIRPLGFSLAGYRAVLNNSKLLLGYGNTLIYVTAGTALSMVLTILGAYTLSRRKMMLQKLLMAIVALPMYFSAGLIPNFLLIRNLGLYNRYSAIILSGAFSCYNVIVMRTAFRQLPQSLEESAMIDGANDWVILSRIILPMSKATVAVIALFFAVGNWNSWFTATIYLRDRDKYPLQLFLREILLASSTVSMADTSTSSLDGMYFLEESIKYCTIIVATVPVLCIYPFVQKYFVTGLMLGSLKE